MFKRVVEAFFELVLWLYNLSMEFLRFARAKPATALIAFAS